MLTITNQKSWNNFVLFVTQGGPYSVFSGRDASRGLATFSVDKSQFKDTYDDLSDLTASQLGSVKEWEMQFLGIKLYQINIMCKKVAKLFQQFV